MIRSLRMVRPLWLAPPRQVREDDTAMNTFSRRRLTAAVAAGRYLPRIPPIARAKITFVPSATRKVGSAVMTGQIPSERSRSGRCGLVDPLDSEWMLAAIASPKAPSATAMATWRATERDEFGGRERSYTT